MFFFDCEKEPKSVEGCDSLHTSPNAPWQVWARHVKRSPQMSFRGAKRRGNLKPCSMARHGRSRLGQQTKRGFVNQTKPFFFCSCPRESINTKVCQVQVHLRTIILKHLTRFCCLCNSANKKS